MDMTNFEFLQKYTKLQTGIMFDGIVDLGFSTVGYSKTDKSGYWNNALVNNVLSEVEVAKIEEILTSKDRKPTIYFENREDLISLEKLLSSRNYAKKWEDSCAVGSVTDAELLGNYNRGDKINVFLADSGQSEPEWVEIARRLLGSESLKLRELAANST